MDIKDYLEGTELSDLGKAMIAFGVFLCQQQQGSPAVSGKSIESELPSTNVEHPILTRPTMRPSEVAEFLNRDSLTVRRRCKSGKYRHKVIGSEYHVFTQSVWDNRFNFDDEWKE